MGASAESLLDYFEIDQTLVDSEKQKPRYNIAPSQDAPIVRDTGHG